MTGSTTDDDAAVHNILKKAMRAAPAEARPARPHFGGALPVLSARSQLAIALALVDETARRFPPADAARFATLRTAARDVHLADARPPRAALDAVSKRAKSDAPAIRVAKYAVRTAGNFLYSPAGARNAVGANVEGAAVAVVEALVADGGDVAGFLAWLDDAVLRHHLAQQLAERDFVSSTPIARVLSRTPGAVLARLSEPEQYGLFCKLRTRWQWHEGDRATMFATVPDAYLSDVAADLERAEDGSATVTA